MEDFWGFAFLIALTTGLYQCGAYGARGDLDEKKHRLEEVKERWVAVEKEKRSVEGVKRRLIATLASKQSGDSVETRENAIVPFSGNNLVMPVKPRLDRFVRENIPSVLFTQEELAATRRRYEEAIAALAAQLELMGRDLNKDQELKQWKTQLVAVTAAQKSIRETSVEAFIAYRKFELSPDSLTTSEQFKKLVKEAQNSAAEAQSNFISLMEGT